MANLTGFVFSGAAVGLSTLLFQPAPRGFFPNPPPAPLGQPPSPPPAYPDPIVAQATIEEVHHDELEIVDHPVEANAAISDHAYKRPAEVIIHCAWSDSPSSSPSIISQAVGAAATLLGPAAQLAAAAVPTFNAASSLINGNAPSQSRAIYQQLQDLQASRVPFTILTGKRLYVNMLIKSLSVTTDKDRENSLWVTVACREILLATVQTLSSVPAAPAQQAAPWKTAATVNTGANSLVSSSAQFSTIPGVPQ